MELVLESAEGVPPGSILSVKVGSTKRQASASNVGQPFRFVCSQSAAVAVTFELLKPAAAAQTVLAEPSSDRCTVDFGDGCRVVLKQRAVEELRSVPAELKIVAPAGAVPSEEEKRAMEALSYLEQHDLVRTLQGILHGMLTEKPADPKAYMERELAKLKPSQADGKELSAASAREAPQGQAVPAAAPSQPSAPAVGGPEPPSAGAGAQRGGYRSSLRGSLRGSAVSRGKVETLFLSLQCTHDNLPIVLPFLPSELRATITGKQFLDECDTYFKQLDTKQRGQLSDADCLPILQKLSEAKMNGIGADQCRRFIEMFDTDDDGMINRSDFVSLVQFVVVLAYLESPEGKKTLDQAKVEESNFQDFMQIIEGDKERLWSIIPFLPQWLCDHVTSQEFQDGCNARFKTLDADGSGSLEPNELIPIIQELSKAHPLIIDAEKCKRFVRIFDIHGNGVILQDEFIEFAQFVTVMNFLSSTEEGKQVQLQAEITRASGQTQALIDRLAEDPTCLNDVLGSLPQALVNELYSFAFKESCLTAYAKLDREGTGAVKADLLYPLLQQLAGGNPYRPDVTQCEAYTHLFKKIDAGGRVAQADFADLARFVLVLSYLYFTKENQEMLCAEVLLGREKIAVLLETLSEGMERVWELLPFLPESLASSLFADDFLASCDKEFANLDVAKKGSLEPKDLQPLLSSLAEANQYALSEEHCRRFVDIFDTTGSRTVSKEVYANFKRFMIIMAFMETAEGQQVSAEAEISKGKESVEELLEMLQHDRKAVHKIVPLLPQQLFDELTSDQFVKDCHSRFMELDKEKAGVLQPKQLVPLVVELSSAHPFSVTEDQCRRFTQIFDIHGDGVLRPDEFLDFTRFIFIMSFLHTPEGKEAANEAVTVMVESKKIEDLLDEMERDRGQINKVIRYLPSWLREDLISEHFTLDCLSYFQDLDKDNSGTLEPEELYPMVLSLSNASAKSLDVEQCRRFTAIFDDQKKGVICTDDFVNFARFLIIMSYLRSKEGSMYVAAAAREDRERLAASTVQRPSAPAPGSEPPAPVRQRSEAHLAVDCEFFEKKAAKLSSENAELRDKLHDMEKLMRSMQNQMEEQHQRLRHAEVELGSGSRS